MSTALNLIRSELKRAENEQRKATEYVKSLDSAKSDALVLEEIWVGEVQNLTAAIRVLEDLEIAADIGSAHDTASAA